MGGHGEFHTVKLDPAAERWNHMREHTYQHFKMTRPISNKIIAFGLVIPAGIFTLAKYTDEKWDWIGARKGESTTQRGTFHRSQVSDESEE